MAAGSLWLLYKPGLLDEHWNPRAAVRAALCVLSLLAYALLFEVLGFVISTALAAFALGLLFTGRLIPCAISAVLMGVLLYGLFDYLLDVPLPLGLFEAFVES
jgi:putative tricarboxylic transport membrane protein